jgi:hypothetical protein
MDGRKGCNLNASTEHESGMRIGLIYILRKVFRFKEGFLGVLIPKSSFL